LNCIETVPLSITTAEEVAIIVGKRMRGHTYIRELKFVGDFAINYVIIKILIIRQDYLRF
tara:strand:+ start:237 stop:416 length:180 start_codon:yes stop_codon:yes gene_type:complete